MIGRKTLSAISAALALTLLVTLLGGCSMQRAAEEPAALPEARAEAEIQAEPEAEAGRRDGERFDAVIVLEGKEETVHYEHARSKALGFELDYDYETLARRSDAERERFVSVWDNPDAPENYLELSFRAESADAVAASVREELSQKYELLEDTRELERAGSCLRIEASVLKGTGTMADQLQVVYLIPAADGCLVAAEHFAAEASEGFGRRFSYILNTLALIDRRAESLSDEDALTAVRNYCYLSNPDLAGIVNAGEYPVYWELSSGTDAEAAVLFRSYTGAQLRFYIDRVTGDARVTEFVPGASAEETPTGERFNARDYLPFVPGTWQTASVAYAADGTMQPEYHVLFTNAGILYGHMKDGAFVFDHADPIRSLERIAAGGVRIRALSSNEVQYTYQSCESDAGILEYYETWDEAAFPDMYRGGASLSGNG